jgi:hypothetical protein
VDNFVASLDCDELILDLDRYVRWTDIANIHNGRLSLPNSDPIFQELLEKSQRWVNFYKKIYSTEFLQWVESKFEKNNEVCKLSFDPVLSKKRPEWIKKITSGSSTPLKFCSIKKIFFYLIARIIFKPFLSIRLWPKKIITGNIPVDLLFDVSKANQGYAREIHRDSDSRLYVFLIYFNDLENSNAGGDLLLYKYLREKIPNAQPAESDCELIQKVSPKKGRLVVFKNDDFAFHAVSQMQKSAGYRYFCYGGFTSLLGVNPFINESALNFGTAFHEYL